MYLNLLAYIPLLFICFLNVVNFWVFLFGISELYQFGIES